LQQTKGIVKVKSSEEKQEKDLYSAHRILTERAMEEKIEMNSKKTTSIITVIDKEIIIQVIMIFSYCCI
jgi:hypothetical protein